MYAAPDLFPILVVLATVGCEEGMNVDGSTDIDGSAEVSAEIDGAADVNGSADVGDGVVDKA